MVKSVKVTVISMGGSARELETAKAQVVGESSLGFTYHSEQVVLSITEGNVLQSGAQSTQRVSTHKDCEDK